MINIIKQNITSPHIIGIQKPGMSVLVKPMEMDVIDRNMRYAVKRERKTSKNKRANLFIM